MFSSILTIVVASYISQKYIISVFWFTEINHSVFWQSTEDFKYLSASYNSYKHPADWTMQRCPTVQPLLSDPSTSSGHSLRAPIAREQLQTVSLCYCTDKRTDVMMFNTDLRSFTALFHGLRLLMSLSSPDLHPLPCWWRADVRLAW